MIGMFIFGGKKKKEVKKVKEDFPKIAPEYSSEYSTTGYPKKGYLILLARMDPEGNLEKIKKLMDAKYDTQINEHEVHAIGKKKKIFRLHHNGERCTAEGVFAHPRVARAHSSKPREHISPFCRPCCWRCNG